MVAGESRFPTKPRTRRNTTATSIESSPTTSSGVDFQETHFQKRKIPNPQSVPLTGSCQEDGRKKRTNYGSEYRFPSNQSLSSSSALISTMPSSLPNIVVHTNRIPLPPKKTNHVSTKCELLDKSFDMGNGKNKRKADNETADLISIMQSSFRLFGKNIIVPAKGIPSAPSINSDQVSVRHELFDGSLDRGDGKNKPKSDNEDDQSPLPSSSLGKPTETQDLLSGMPSSLITPPTSSDQISTKLTLFDESWNRGSGKINLSKFKGRLDHEEVSIELKLYK